MPVKLRLPFSELSAVYGKIDLQTITDIKRLNVCSSVGLLKNGLIIQIESGDEGF